MGCLWQTLQKFVLLIGSMSGAASSHKDPHIDDLEDHPAGPVLGFHSVVVPWVASGMV